MSEKKLGIIIPYRDRLEHLDLFLKNAKIFGDLNYEIIIVEQVEGKPFNRGKLLNIGFDLSKDSCDYFCFHDVDMLPKKIDYSYTQEPLHLACNVPQFSSYYYGGVNMLSKENFININGFSNEFWGWGGEDDDLLKRVYKIGFPIKRRYCEYESLYHKPNGPNHNNYKNNLDRCRKDYDYQSEGLNTLSYEIIDVKEIDYNVKHITVSI